MNKYIKLYGLLFFMRCYSSQNTDITTSYKNTGTKDDKNKDKASDNRKFKKVVLGVGITILITSIIAYILHNNHKKTSKSDSKSKKQHQQQNQKDQSNIVNKEEFNILYNKAKELFPESKLITNKNITLLKECNMAIQNDLENKIFNNQQISLNLIREYFVLIQSIIEHYIKYNIMINSEIFVIRNIIAIVIINDKFDRKYTQEIKNLLISLINKAIPQFANQYNHNNEHETFGLVLEGTMEIMISFYQSAQFNFLSVLQTYLNTEEYKDLVDSVKNEKVKAILNKHLT